MVGLVSIIGYTLDIFIGPISGYYLDTYSGKQGFQFIFAGLVLCATIGALPVSYFANSQEKHKTEVFEK